MLNRNDTSPPARRSIRRSSRGLAFAGALSALTLCAGCGDQQLDTSFKKLFELKKSPQQYALIAFSDADPDVRRDALTKLAKTKEFDRDWAIKGYITVALLETNDQTRCIAVRALARTGDPRAVDTLLQIVNFEKFPPAEVRPPTDIVRWDSTIGLADLSAAGKVPEAQHDAVRMALLAQLKYERDHQVRAAAARGLGWYPTDDVVRALIGVMRDEKFSVVHAAEESLVRMTGVTQQSSAIGWEKWYAENEQQLFVNAGYVPVSRRLPYNNRFEKAWWNTKQTWRVFFPGRKE